MRFRDRFKSKTVLIGKHHKLAMQNQLNKACVVHWFNLLNTWLKQYKDKFVIPIERVRWHRKKRFGCKGKKSKVTLFFEGVTRHLKIQLDDRYGCWAVVVVNGNEWDSVLDLDLYPVELPDGRWADRLNLLWYKEDQETRQLESEGSLAALFESQVLQPLLRWVNETLAQSDRLCLYGTLDESRWAELGKVDRVFGACDRTVIPLYS